MSLKSLTRILIVFTLLTASVASADVLDKLPRDVRLKFLESLKVTPNGRFAGAWINDVRKHLNRADYRQFLSMFGWGPLGEDHKDMACVKAGTCGHSNGDICDPSACKDPCKCGSLGDRLQVLSPSQRTEFLMALRFNNGRATNLPLDKIRRYLKPSEIAELEKMAR